MMISFNSLFRSAFFVVYKFSLVADAARFALIVLMSRLLSAHLLLLLLNSIFAASLRVLLGKGLCMLGIFAVTFADDLDQTIFSLTQLSATQLSITFAEHPRIGALKLAAACS